MNRFQLCNNIVYKYLICVSVGNIIIAENPGQKEVFNITEQDLIMNLQAAGFDESSIQEFLICWSAGEREKQLRLLSQKREGLLAQVHREEKQIHCLDYLVYRLEEDKS